MQRQQRVQLCVVVVTVSEQAVAECQCGTYSNEDLGWYGGGWGLGELVTWWGWASAFRLYKEVVVGGDVARFQCFPHVLITLKEQMVHYEFINRHTHTPCTGRARFTRAVFLSQTPHRLSQSAWIVGCCAPTKRSSSRWGGPLPVAETSGGYRDWGSLIEISRSIMTTTLDLTLFLSM